MNKPKVAFICLHNSCRSQMAEAISKIIANDAYDAYSAGTQAAEQINADAVNIIKKLYGVDMSLSQKPKTLAQIPPVDIVVTMGCGVNCPYLSAKHREDWGLADPTGKNEEAFICTARLIEHKVSELKLKINSLMQNKAED